MVMILSICVDQQMVLEHKYRTICPTSSEMELLIFSSVSLDLYPLWFIVDDDGIGVLDNFFFSPNFFFLVIGSEKSARNQLGL